MVDYDIVIVGSGPAGLATAFYLKDSVSQLFSSKRLKVAILDKTTYPSGGLINDGKMNLTPHIGFDDFKDGRVSEAVAWEHIRYFEDIICRHGDNPPLSGVDDARIKYWKDRFEPHNISMVPETRQRHIGTDRSRKLIDGMRSELTQSGIEFLLGQNVQEFWRRNNHFEISVHGADGEYSLTSNYLVVATGRLGTRWFRKRLDGVGANYDLLPIEVGVRLEMLCEDYPITSDIRDPKLKVKAPNGDIVKTFCTNPRGRIRLDMPEQGLRYKDMDLIMINGDGLRDPDHQTPNTNFAILNKIALKNPEGDTEEYAKYLVINTFRAGGWKPIVQRLGHFFDDRRSKREHFGNGERVHPSMSLNSVTPGDINIAYFSRIIANMRFMIDALARVMPQVKNPDNLVYAPEAKFQNLKVNVSPFLETTVPNLFVAGNGAGLSSGIVGAASNGILVAKGLLERIV
ncbi:FAD-dependent oxidoreductase [Candidatus Woesearchaeota archaeon]|nr:FAD-dependent oxidoreductase [Candidatus Woesearchaeota archaeon]